MDAIYRVDGNRVVTEPRCRRPLGCQHAARLGAGGAGRVGRRGDPDARADADCARHHRPDAPGAGGAADARRAKCCARGARSSFARSGCWPATSSWSAPPFSRSGRRRCHCRRTSRTGRSNCPGRISRSRARGFLQQPVRDRDVAARRPRPVRRARTRRDLVPGRPAAGRGIAGLAGDARGGRRGFLQRHLGGAGFPGMDLHQCRPHRQPGAAAGRRVDPARCAKP